MKQESIYGRVHAPVTHVVLANTCFVGAEPRRNNMEPEKLTTDAFGIHEARKLWDKAFIDVIGLALALGEPEMAKKLGALRAEAGFVEKIDWTKL